VLSAVIVVLVALYALAQLRFVIVCSLARFAQPSMPPSVDPLLDFPTVAVQVAAYREAPALPGLLEAILQLDWPRDRYFVQIIDDSVGADARASREVVEQLSCHGVRIDYLNRGSRAGYKAGALNHGIAAARDVDLIAYFDADCRPRREFLTRLVPQFSDDRVAAVQARWEYPNGGVSPLTMVQQAAFEYLFRYEYGLRAWLESPVYYLGSAAIWRREAIEALGGWRTHPFTAEDVDMGCRARAAGWTVLYDPTALADDDAVEDILAFRAQQRRWAHAVSRAALDASRGFLHANWSWPAFLIDLTGLVPHATIVLTLVTTLLIALHVMLGGERTVVLNRAEWLFAALVAASPAVVALVLATRHYHPDRWLSRTALLMRAGFAGAATMTSFVFGLADLARQRRMEFVTTPKDGQVGVIADSRRRWVGMLYGPIAFDAAVAVFLVTATAIAVRRDAVNAAVPAILLGAAFAVSFVYSLVAVSRHRSRLIRATAQSRSGEARPA
jgi:cellulose synthase/poly-beta-1,6-N-acetylglucosamine synthase-like glycosyltransferase